MTAAPGTVSGYTRQPFPDNIVPVTRMDPVMARLIQSYPLPDVPGLANNQFTNPELINNYNYGNIRADANLTSKDTVFGRFSPQKATVNTPTAFGYRQVPGLSIPLNLHNGVGSITPGDATFSNMNAVLAWTHIFTPRFLSDFPHGLFAIRHAQSLSAGGGSRS